MKSVLKLSNLEAKEFFLKEESYCTFELPKYFKFETLVQKVSQKLSGKTLSNFYNTSKTANPKKPRTIYPWECENVNYQFLNNKDGKFGWRPFQLIHPALYVSLVHKITEPNNWNFILQRFRELHSNLKIKCLSIPLESNEQKYSDKAATVLNWWQAIEQQSIELALKYAYVIHTDISDCYGSIYTHSISWALHTKIEAKKEKHNVNLIGNLIDKHCQHMAFGQTNGIPQGSVLMNFIAEMVLGFADFELSARIKALSIKDYQIIRYRDDYRIFTNNPQDGEIIVKNITEILIDLGMRLNAQKTLVSHQVIKDSIKPDKLFWMLNRKQPKNLQEHLLVIHEIAHKFPNSGTLIKTLNKFFDRIKELDSTTQNIAVLISILVDIAFNNPRAYPVFAAILSKLLTFLSPAKQKRTLSSIKTRFSKIPNTGHLQVWLQRVTIKMDPAEEYKELLCQKISDPAIKVWNSDWLNKSLQTLINKTTIIDHAALEAMTSVIEGNEVELFNVDYE